MTEHCLIAPCRSITISQILRAGPCRPRMRSGVSSKGTIGKAAINTIAQVCLVAVDVSNKPNDTQQVGRTDLGPG